MNWNGSALTGFQKIENDTKIFLYMKPEEVPVNISVLKEGTLTEGNKTTGKNACLVLKYPKSTKKIRVRYGISFIDAQQG